MSISEKYIKILWGRAAGICSFPSCGEELTKYLQGNNDFVIGEMAHVIASAEGGPRGDGKGGRDTYDNLLLLCPTHHRTIDKAPEGTYPIEILFEWKKIHERNIRGALKGFHVTCWDDLKNKVNSLVIENFVTWKTFGPESKEAKNNPTSNAYNVWQLKKIDTIVPNNEKIVNIIEMNIELLSTKQREIFYLFKQHCVGFEQNMTERLDYYPTFPKEFGKMFNE